MPVYPTGSYSKTARIQAVPGMLCPKYPPVPCKRWLPGKYTVKIGEISFRLKYIYIRILPSNTRSLFQSRTSQIGARKTYNATNL